MRKVFVIVVAIACLVGQSLAVAAQGVDAQRAVEHAHQAFHALNGLHHHHDDGAAHFDESPDSGDHAHGDSLCCAVAALPCSIGTFSFEGHPVLKPIQGSQPPFPPFLEGPRRPPRPQA